MSSGDRNVRQMFQSYVDELWTNGNLDLVDEIVHPDVYDDLRPGGMWKYGIDGVKRWVEGMRAASPDLTRRMLDLVVSGDEAVLFTEIEGTHTGGRGLQLPPLGSPLPFRMTTAGKYLLRDGKILAEPWSLHDTGATRPDALKAIGQRLIAQLWNDGDVSLVNQIYADALVRTDPLVTLGRTGTAALKDAVTRYRTDFTDLEFSIESMVAGDSSIAVRWNAAGGFRGEVNGIVGDGSLVTFSGTTITRFEGALAVEEHMSWDTGVLRTHGG